MGKSLHFISGYRKKRHILIFLTGLALFSFQKSTATTFYINDNSTKGDIYTKGIGNDSNDGISPATPKLSILTTYEKAQEGDTIIIDTGIYKDLSSDGKLLFPVTKKITFKIAGIQEPVFSKISLPVNIKVNPEEIYIDQDKPVDRNTYLHKKKTKKSQ